MCPASGLLTIVILSEAKDPTRSDGSGLGAPQSPPRLDGYARAFAFPRTFPTGSAAAGCRIPRVSGVPIPGFAM
jgi:hypothetical protein